MAVSAVGAVGASSISNIYATYSPYLNGVVRTSDAAQAARIDATANAASTAATAASIAAQGDATATTTAAPPFINPAISEIGARIALGQALTPPAVDTPDALLGASSLDGTTATTPLEQALQSDTTLTTASTVTNPFAINPLVTAPADSLSVNAIDATTTTNAATAPQTTQPSPFAQIAYGDAGELIQSYGAIALVTGPQALAASAFAQPVTPYVAPAAIVTPVKASSAIA